ncbi:MAG: cation-translocating P-type ATPase [Candidatus Aenigmarchaeota archaeon]|nr:cation-translocating P-type ATPase [Candidatus Aenigmarchaeota archaeon]
MKKWHAMTCEQVKKDLKTHENGLKNSQVHQRLKEYGENKLKNKEKRTSIIIFLEQFKSFLVILLIFATFISLLMGLRTDAMVIGAILVLNAFLGFYQEHKAEKAIEALRKMIVTKALVLRDGQKIEIDVEHLVPGDIVILDSGNRVPADLRLIEAINMKIDESMLTGESVPATKNTKKLTDVPLSERENMAFMGTLVNYGRGVGIVVSTGMETVMGKIAGMVQEREEQTPLQKKLQHLGKTLSIVVLIEAVFIFIIGLARSLDIFDMFLTALSLSIAAVPEGLPAVITLTLAIGTQRMLKKNAVVKKLAAVEALGSTTVICADKTGTMTTNEMTVKKMWSSGKTVDVSGIGFNPKGEFLLDKKKIDPKKYGALDMIIKIGSMCNNSLIRRQENCSIIGDPTEGALKVLANKAGLKEDYKKLDEIPFSSERKKMTTIHNVDGEIYAFTKGAPEVILKSCSKLHANRKLTRKEIDKTLETVKDFAEKGMRVLGFSYKKLSKKYSLESAERDMTFAGLVAMIDPPRKETKKAIMLCKKAGIKIKMITGDHELTAKAVAAEVGLNGKVLRGEDLDKLDNKQLNDIVREVTIFARVSPNHKIKIVDALKKAGHVVAMTGDGVNDAPALKKADIGVAMGIKGTDVAKESSDMVLMDDNFSTIVSAVEEGRGIYDNIRKFVKFLLAANFAELITITAAIIVGFSDPLTGAAVLPFVPIQILWINLITDGIPALALSVDPKDKNIMKENPRNPKKGIVNGLLPFILAVSILHFVTTFFAFFTVFQETGIPIKAQTVALTTTILFEMFFVFNCRSDKKGILRNNPLKNKKLFLAVIISVVLQLMIIYVPFLQNIFHTTALTASDWIKVLAFSSFGIIAMPEIFMKKPKVLK